jgi:hypothetical protein
MAKMRTKLGLAIIVILLVGIGTLALTVLADTSSWEIDLPPFDLPDKGHPTLDSQLNRLVRAEKRGEAASFAEQSNIELIDSSVRVIIECMPGQVDVATEAATGAGATLETSYNNLLQVVVPISRLTALADASSIHFIRLPQYPVPG